MTGRPTSAGDLTSAEQPIVFVIDDESIRYREDSSRAHHEKMGTRSLADLVRITEMLGIGRGRG